MVKRKIVNIDEEKCNGCGYCIPNCQEGALQIIDGKARLISDYFCDGLGACLGHCPMDAITIEEREAKPYNETLVMESIAKQGANTIKAHLMHLKEHNEFKFLQEAVDYLKKHGIPVPSLEEEQSEHPMPCGCPGTMATTIKRNQKNNHNLSHSTLTSELTQWPIQLHLVPPSAPFLKGSHLLISASCTAFSLASFHGDLLRRKKILIACPKLDKTDPYKEKLIKIFKINELKSITVAIMEVPCCKGLYQLVQSALEESGVNVPLIKETISIDGKIL